MTQTNLSVTPTNEAVKQLDKIAVVCLNMSVWSGTKTISQTELEAAGGTALPNSIADIGSKKVFNPEDLAPFAKVRTRAYRYLRAHGVNFCRGAVAIPLNESDAILTGLDLLIDEFNRYKADFLASYDQKLQDWIQQNPGYEDLIRNGALTKTEVAKRFDASVNVLQVQNIREKDRERNARLADDLGTRLLDEVSADAEKYNQTIVLRQSIARRGIPVIAKLRDKLRSLAFLTSSIQPVVNMLDDVLTRLPATGELEGSDCSNFKVAVMILANRKLLQQFVDGEISYESQRSALFSANPDVQTPEQMSIPNNEVATSVSKTETETETSAGDQNQQLTDDVFVFDTVPEISDVHPEKDKQAEDSESSDSSNASDTSNSLNSMNSSDSNSDTAPDPVQAEQTRTAFFF